MKQSEYNHAYYMANREKLLARHNEWNRSHTKETAERKRKIKEGTLTPRPKLSEEELAEHRDAYHKRYVEAHREEINAKARERREENPEKIREYRRKYYEGHREEFLAYQRKYRAKKKEARAVEEAQRRVPA